MFKFWKTKEVVKKFTSSENESITFENLKQFKINVIEQIDEQNIGDIECVRLNNNNENELSFKVKMKKGTFWKIHNHDCLETILIYKGSLIEKIKNRVIKRLTPLEIKPNVPHIIGALEDSIFYVEFTNSK